MTTITKKTTLLARPAVTIEKLTSAYGDNQLRMEEPFKVIGTNLNRVQSGKYLFTTVNGDPDGWSLASDFTKNPDGTELNFAMFDSIGIADYSLPMRLELTLDDGTTVVSGEFAGQ